MKVKIVIILVLFIIQGNIFAQKEPFITKSFPFNIHQKTTSAGQNTLLSPYSISSALGMTYLGAKGQTKEQMSAVLNFSLDTETFLKESKANIQSIKSRNGLNLEIATSNTLWLQKNFVFKANYKQQIVENFNASIKNVDFVHNTEATRLEINNWVKKQTKNKIKDLLSKGMIDSGTRMVLVNAVYFNGEWKNAFNTNDTKNLRFNINNNTKKDVPFMCKQDFYQYYENQELQILQIPYANDDIAMYILLPHNTEGLTALEEKLNIDQLNNYFAKLQSYEVAISLPKFKFEYTIELSKVLPTMGMKDAFLDCADFSGITGNKGLKIDKVIHKTFIDVSEKGTEAAGATAVTMRETSSAHPVQKIIKQFNANHPFLFFIYDKPTKTILFIGHVYNPILN